MNAITETKICSKCKEEKDLSCFAPRSDSPNGLRNSCRECRRLHNKNKYNYDPDFRANYNLNQAKFRKTDKYKLLLKRKYQRNKNNPKYKIVNNLRRRLLFVLEGKRKADHTIKLVGCTKESLEKHLESQFQEGMSWSNYGDWHIDHKLPCASFDLSQPEQQRKCFHYSNLQPLWAADNLSKGDSLPLIAAK